MPKYLFVLFLSLYFSFFAKAQTTTFIEHRVRWMENIYTISRKYHIDPNAILAYNRLSANEVRRGVILRIPIGNQEDINNNQSIVTEIEDPANAPNLASLINCYEYRPSSGTTHRASLILPFDLSSAQPNNQYLEFYAGLLLALRDLKDEGMSIRFSSFDSKSYSYLPALVQSGALRDEELIIGPVFQNDVLEMLNYTYGQNIKIISPLFQETESAATTNENFFQVNTPLYWQQYNLIQHLQKNRGVVWLFMEEGGVDQELVNLTIDILRKSGIIYREFRHKVAKDRDISGELSQLLVQGENNQVIVASRDEAFVSDILRNLYFVHSKRNCPVTLYGNAWWPNFESVDIDHYHNMTLHLSVAQYVDYQKPEVKRFLSQYRSMYRAEPSRFAFQGYDVGY